MSKTLHKSLSTSYIENSNMNQNQSQGQVVDYSTFEKLKRKKKLISDKFAIIIYYKNIGFFKKREYTKENLADYLKELMIFESITDYNYNKLLKKLEEKVIEKVQPLQVVIKKVYDYNKVMLVTNKESKDGNTSFDQNKHKLNKTSLGQWPCFNRNRSTGNKLFLTSYHRRYIPSF